MAGVGVDLLTGPSWEWPSVRTATSPNVLKTSIRVCISSSDYSPTSIFYSASHSLVIPCSWQQAHWPDSFTDLLDTPSYHYLGKPKKWLFRYHYWNSGIASAPHRGQSISLQQVEIRKIHDDKSSSALDNKTWSPSFYKRLKISVEPKPHAVATVLVTWAGVTRAAR